jgi:hypothetical protein
MSLVQGKLQLALALHAVVQRFAVCPALSEVQMAMKALLAHSAHLQLW